MLNDAIWYDSTNMYTIKQTFLNAQYYAIWYDSINMLKLVEYKHAQWCDMIRFCKHDEIPLNMIKQTFLYAQWCDLIQFLKHVVTCPAQTCSMMRFDTILQTCWNLFNTNMTKYL